MAAFLQVGGYCINEKYIRTEKNNLDCQMLSRRFVMKMQSNYNQ